MKFKLKNSVLSMFRESIGPLTKVLQMANFKSLSFRGVLKNFAKFTEKHLCQSLFFNKATLLKKRLCHMCFPLSFAKFWRTPILRSICERLHLKLKVMNYRSDIFADTFKLPLVVKKYTHTTFFKTRILDLFNTISLLKNIHIGILFRNNV